jgi:hypothetical protein
VAGPERRSPRRSAEPDLATLGLDLQITCGILVVGLTVGVTSTRGSGTAWFAGPLLGAGVRWPATSPPLAAAGAVLLTVLIVSGPPVRAMVLGVLVVGFLLGADARTTRACTTVRCWARGRRRSAAMALGGGLAPVAASATSPDPLPWWWSMAALVAAAAAYAVATGPLMKAAPVDEEGSRPGVVEGGP